MTEKEESEYCKNYTINQNRFRIKQLYNKPLTRFNLTSPYYNEATGKQATDANGKEITKERLDMRRKAEILKYSSNRMSTQTNNLTKKEKWAQLVNTRGRTTTIFDIENVICPNDALIPMPSSASGVPGSTYLYEDPSVPLYNYTNINRTYAFDVPNRNEYWDTTVNTNVGIISKVEETIFVMSIHRNVNNNTATYSLNIPLGIHLKGTYTDGLKTVTTKISEARLDVYYNSRLLTDVRKIIEHPYKNMTIDFSNNLLTNTEFSATQYVGDISFSNITLRLSDAYVFEFKLALTTIVEPGYVEGSTRPTPPPFTSYAYANITDSIPETNKDCSVINKKDIVTASTLSTPSLLGRL